MQTLQGSYEISQKEIVEVKYDYAWMNFFSCENCPNLYKDISSLKCKLEWASKLKMDFVVKDKHFDNHLKSLL